MIKINLFPSWDQLCKTKQKFISVEIISLGIANSSGINFICHGCNIYLNLFCLTSITLYLSDYSLSYNSICNYNSLLKKLPLINIVSYFFHTLNNFFFFWTVICMLFLSIYLCYLNFQFLDYFISSEEIDKSISRNFFIKASL